VAPVYADAPLPAPESLAGVVVTGSSAMVSHREPWSERTAAWLAAAALAGLAGWHAGCVTSGSCLGTATDLPWGYALDGGTVDRHPVELYAALLLAGAAIAVAAWKQRGFPPRGAPAAAAIAAATSLSQSSAFSR